MAIDLTTQYLGLSLANPLVVSACPITREVHQIEQLAQAGAAAIVMYSLFGEQSAGDTLRQSTGTERGYAETQPVTQGYGTDLDAYLENIELAKRNVAIPIIGSLNVCEPGDWTRFAPLIEQAGADALELNIYFVPTDPRMSGAQVEARYAEMVATVRQQIAIPLSVKIGPYFSSLPYFAQQLVDAGADGLVLFNRFLQPDVDVDSFEVTPRLTLSTPDEIRLPLRWIAILRSQISASLAATSGIHSIEGVAKVLLAGADVAMIASALLQNGPVLLTHLQEGLAAFLNSKGLASVDALRGLVSQARYQNPDAFERANYIKALASYRPDAPS